MGLWHWIDKIVGYIPVVGTVKDGVESLVLECEGKHEAAKEKAMEAAIGLAGDIITVATLGEGYEIALAGKAAAEAAMKDAVESGVKSAAKQGIQQAMKEGFSKQVATHIAVAEAAQEIKNKAKEEIAKRAGKKVPSQQSKTKTDKSKKDPKRGHHVINNGVRKVFPKIIDHFLEQNAHYFHGQDFDRLVDQGHILPTMIVHRSHEHPFNVPDDEFIQTTVAFTPPGDTHRDANDVQYSTLMVALTLGVSNYMTSLFRVLPLRSM